MRTRKAYFMASVVIAFSVLSLSGHGAAADASLKDDAYHYLHNGIDDQLYNEWWYFNGISNDTQFYISYLLSDPENLTGMRKFQVRATVLEEGKPPVIGIHQSKGFGGDKDGPNVDIDQSGLSYQDESKFRVWGTVEDISSGEPIKWDLAYESASSPWFATPVQSHIGHTKGDWMKWLVYMPSARVSGTLSWDNQTRNMEAVGYHDHNWGRWAFNDPQLNWAQVSVPDDGFSFVMGDMIGEQRNTVLGINFGDDTSKFSGKQIKLNYTDFALDPLTSRMYPAAYRASADNGDYDIDVNIKVIENVPMLISYPAPLPSYVVFEQVALFNGTLRSDDGEVYQFENMGFSQYTTHRLHPIFGIVSADDMENAGADDTGINSTNIADTGVAIAITAMNERTGQVKASNTASDGSFSFDADYADYLSDSTAPWVADGDTLRLEARDAAGRQGNGTITIDMAEDAQDIGLIELN